MAEIYKTDYIEIKKIMAELVFSLEIPPEKAGRIFFSLILRTA